MEAVIFIGMQASGKTTFYRERFFGTHVRISLDMLHTRNRERILLQACLAAQQSFVVDNTNVRLEERARYLQPARAAGFRLVGYFFQTDLRSAIARNQNRSDKRAIPVPGVIGTYKRLEPPNLSEGFHDLYSVRIDPGNGFSVSCFPPAEDDRSAPAGETG